MPHPHHTTGGEGEDLIWDQYMGPIPYGGGRGGWQGLVHIYTTEEAQIMPNSDSINIGKILLLNSPLGVTKSTLKNDKE